ncbi:hypothetical protein LCGC14_1774560 [marine sediment metagenome]|uniref:Uncharacterized protein n=1 Tax=marine sediment metagenome TaxID=412755 RepID=A0A0F9HJR4_9ZZZZ
MYKDEDKQKEANRQASQRRRDRKGMTQGMTNQGMTVINEPSNVIPKRGKDIKCFADLPVDVQSTINTISESPEEHRRRTAIAINYQHQFLGRYCPEDAVCSGVVTGKPGDADYNGICTPEWRAERGR